MADQRVTPFDASQIEFLRSVGVDIEETDRGQVAWNRTADVAMSQLQDAMKDCQSLMETLSGCEVVTIV